MLSSKYETHAISDAFDQRCFTEWFSSALADQARHRSPVSVLRFDIDDFERVIGSYGVHVGNGVLRIVSASVQRLLRPEDVLIHHGGDAFAVFLQGSSARNAAILAERIRRIVNGLPLVAQGGTFHVSVSVGLAWAPGADPRQEAALLEGAERAVREAISAGKNRVSSVVVA